MRKNKYYIPKGYKGISEEIKLQFNTNLAVITGLNGSGKSTILKFLYENYPDRSKCFIKAPSIENTQNQNRRININYGRQNRFFDEINFENIIEDIESLAIKKRGRLDSPFLDRTDFYSSLFDSESINFEKGYEYLEAIAHLLAEYQFDEVDNIKKELGVVTEGDIDYYLIRELNKNKHSTLEKFGLSKGRYVIDKFQKKELTEDQIREVRKILDSINNRLKSDLRKSARIASEQQLKRYVYDLTTKEFRSIESIIIKMSNKIYQDFKNKSSKRKLKRLWQEINEELEKYCIEGYFKYKLVQPQIYESYYEIAFERFDKSTNSRIHFDSLSSGEKIIFELICYYFAAKESKLELIMLDEFDANLNPQLAERYIDVIKKQFQNIHVILTTHSPSTVVEVKPNELYELTDSRELKCAENENGKRDILRRLAPKFVYHGEFGILEDIFNSKYELIVFVEGKNDVRNFDLGISNEKYKFIDSKGVGNIPDLVKIFKVIPFFQNLAQQKQIVFLFDFDEEGIENLVKCLPKHDSPQVVYNTFIHKEPYCSKIDSDLNIYITHLIPNNFHSWKVADNYRHQELRDEGETGIRRQFDHLIDITRRSYDPLM